MSMRLQLHAVRRRSSGADAVDDLIDLRQPLEVRVQAIA